MRKIFFYMMTITIVLATSCNKDDGEEDGPNRMTLTTLNGGLTIIMNGSGTATVDWGDNTEIETYTLQEYSAVGDQYFNHEYADAPPHTITITGDNIRRFGCNGTALTQLDVKRNPALESLTCATNFLYSLDISRNTALRTLYCNDNEFSELDLSKNTELDSLICTRNNLRKLDVSKCLKLYYLDCGTNLIKSLDFRYNSELWYLGCYTNQLLDLDVSMNTKLGILTCYNNYLTKLDFSANSKLYGVICIGNILTTQALNAMFRTLHSDIVATGSKIIYIENNPGTNDCDISIAENKGWIFR